MTFIIILFDFYYFIWFYDAGYKIYQYLLNYLNLYIMLQVYKCLLLKLTAIFYTMQ